MAKKKIKNIKKEISQNNKKKKRKKRKLKSKNLYPEKSYTEFDRKADKYFLPFMIGLGLLAIVLNPEGFKNMIATLGSIIWAAVPIVIIGIFYGIFSADSSKGELFNKGVFWMFMGLFGIGILGGLLFNP
jgi:hypothetical protein|tara:strand:+ start:193 stop:582 length:390 start_codon:yes stop_codon:yes gene_type:complete